MSKPTACRDCGSTDVEWRQNAAGKWYLAALSHGARGSVYSTGPHYAVCPVSGPRADRLRAIEAHNAEVLANRAEEQRIIEQLVADRAPVAALMAAGANMAQILASGATTEQILDYYNTQQG